MAKARKREGKGDKQGKRNNGKGRGGDGKDDKKGKDHKGAMATTTPKRLSTSRAVALDANPEVT